MIRQLCVLLLLGCASAGRLRGLQAMVTDPVDTDPGVTDLADPMLPPSSSVTTDPVTPIPPILPVTTEDGAGTDETTDGTADGTGTDATIDETTTDETADETTDGISDGTALEEHEQLRVDIADLQSQKVILVEKEKQRVAAHLAALQNMNEQYDSNLNNMKEQHERLVADHKTKIENLDQRLKDAEAQAQRLRVVKEELVQREQERLEKHTADVKAAIAKHEAEVSSLQQEHNRLVTKHQDDLAINQITIEAKEARRKELHAEEIKKLKELRDAKVKAIKHEHESLAKEHQEKSASIAAQMKALLEEQKRLDKKEQVRAVRHEKELSEVHKQHAIAVNLANKKHFPDSKQNHISP